jgi:hypothetical protein
MTTAPKIRFTTIEHLDDGTHQVAHYPDKAEGLPSATYTRPDIHALSEALESHLGAGRFAGGTDRGPNEGEKS